MAVPLDTIMAFHNAFRKDMAGIDSAARESAIGKPGFLPKIERFRFFNEILVWHAEGEELAVFPALEAVAPLVAEAYERDHRGLDSAFDALSHAVSQHNTVDIARAAAAFKFHLDIHLAKEDAHLYRIVAERISLAEQIKAAGIMAGHVPKERFPEVIAWLFPLIGNNDRENVIQNFQAMMPPTVFGNIKPLIQKSVGNDWTELARKIPSLA